MKNEIDIQLCILNGGYRIKWEIQMGEAHKMKRKERKESRTPLMDDDSQ